VKARELREIAQGFGVAGAHHSTRRLRDQRKHVTRRTMSARRLGRGRTLMVCARSAAEMPVVTPDAASMDTVKLVRDPSGARDHRKGGSGARRAPRDRHADGPLPNFAMK